MIKTRSRAGFTLIETSLATLFLGIIVLAVANLVIQMSQIYQKGLALRAINSTGQQIIEDVQRQVNSATSTFNIDQNSDGRITNAEIINNQAQYYREWNKGSSDQRQIAGAFCVSSYSYVWNTAIPLENTSKNPGLLINNIRYRFARIYDPGHVICTDAQWNSAGKSTYNENKQIKISVGGSEKPIELINADESDLMIYDFTILPVTQSTITKQSFISGTFILATKRGGVNIMSNSDYCQGNASQNNDMSKYDDNDFEYCAVNKFNFSTRTGGNAKKNE